jgi:ABC-type sugar transport system substrate-binding protein/AraC-like DNA-binding protein
MKQKFDLYLVIIIIFALASCSSGGKRYKIGVSQCSADIWREKQNAELRMGAYLQENVELRFAAAYDSDERQIEQIDSLIASGIDLLIVAPNQVATISPAIDRAFDQGVPVIVFERKTNSQKYTAFISADNYEMGRIMGEYIVSRLKGRGRVLEIKGLAGSSPAIERHNGFMEALKKAPGIEVVASLQGDWTEPRAYTTVSQWLAAHPDTPVDLVFGMNDRSAIGARTAFKEAGRKLPLFCGIDGLPGENGGIRQVRDSILDASYIYPTHGDQVLQLGMDILEGKPYEKETLLQSALVTRDNASSLLMQSEEMMRQTAYLDRLHEKADSYMQQLDTQRIITLLAIIVIVLLIVSLVLFYIYHVGKVNLRKERVVNTLWNLNPEDIPAVSENTEASEESETTETIEPVANTLFITRFKEVVESRLDESELSVEDLAADMNLSRVQLYRKVKAVTGSTPIELLRTARLNRAYQLLLTTDKSVSEVAYQVGFTAPSYFTKCFKDEYGMLPGDIKK